jgi:hypothetical protein
LHPRAEFRADDEGDVSGGCYLRGNPREPTNGLRCVRSEGCIGAGTDPGTRFRGRICPGCCLG